MGIMKLHIPKIRESSYFPPWWSVEGVSTQRVEELIKALGCDGISKSQVSRICQDLDEVVESILVRSLNHEASPYLWLGVLTQNVREAGRIVNVSVVLTRMEPRSHTSLAGIPEV